MLFYYLYNTYSVILETLDGPIYALGNSTSYYRLYTYLDLFPYEYNKNILYLTLLWLYIVVNP